MLFKQLKTSTYMHIIDTVRIHSKQLNFMSINRTDFKYTYLKKF